MPRLRKSTGFTLVELMVALVVLGAFAAIAVPSFTGLINDNKSESLSNELASIFQYARSTAAQNNATTIVCLSGGVWTVKRGSACSSTQDLRSLTPPDNTVIATTANALPLTFYSNGTSNRSAGIIICNNSVANKSTKITVLNSGQIRVWSKGKSETGSTLTSCTP